MFLRTMSCPASTSKCESVLRRFNEQLQCVICSDLPRNAHICPNCSALFCNSCIRQWLTRPQDEDLGEQDIESCPHCRKLLRPRNLIKLKWFSRIESLRSALEAVEDSGNNNSVTSTARNQNSELTFTEGNFVLRNFVPNRAPFKVFSPKIVDDLGNEWRLEVRPRCQEDNHWIGAYLSLQKGLPGRYEFIVENLNGPLRKCQYAATFALRSSAGTDEFIDSRLIPANQLPLNIEFRFHVRPVSYEEKSKLLQMLLDNVHKQNEQLKGYSNSYCYRVDDFSDKNPNTDIYSEQFEDEFNRWQVGLNTANTRRFVEFKVELLEGIDGLYDITIELSHEDDECEKTLSFQHVFLTGHVAIFNMQIRWSQLEEYGFTHFDEDYLLIRVSVCPVHVDHFSLKDYLSSKSESEDNDSVYYGSDFASEKECYYY